MYCIATIGIAGVASTQIVSEGKCIWGAHSSLLIQRSNKEITASQTYKSIVNLSNSSQLEQHHILFNMLYPSSTSCTCYQCTIHIFNILYLLYSYSALMCHTVRPVANWSLRKACSYPSEQNYAIFSKGQIKQKYKVKWQLPSSIYGALSNSLLMQ